MYLLNKMKTDRWKEEQVEIMDNNHKPKKHHGQRGGSRTVELPKQRAPQPKPQCLTCTHVSHYLYYQCSWEQVRSSGTGRQLAHSTSLS